MSEHNAANNWFVGDARYELMQRVWGCTTGGWTMHAKVGQWTTKSFCGRKVGPSAYTWPPKDGRDACKTCLRLIPSHIEVKNG